MKKELLMQGWHLDKRVSISHIITTVTVAGMMMVWLFTLEGRVKITEVRIETLQANDLAISAELRRIGDSILSKLDSMEARQYEHLKEHINDAG